MLFRDHAPRHWAAGLPVIPIAPGQKRPLLPGWQRFADRLPSEEEQENWLHMYGDHNMGLPLGPASGLVAVDIDTDDEKIINAILSVLPKSPWKRVGKKGMVLIYKWIDNPTARIRDENEKTIVEILSRGTQIVIPPSIHPDTQKPYWANCELVEALPDAPVLPRDADVLIRGALGDCGVKVAKKSKLAMTQFVPAGHRDNALVSMAGLFAMSVGRGDCTLLDALSRIQAWVDNLTEKVVGDAMSVEKAQQKLIEFLVADVVGEKRKTLPVGWDVGLTAEDKKKMGVDFSDDQIEWSYDKIKTYLDETLVDTKDVKDVAFKNSVDFILNRMAYASKLSAMEHDLLLRTIADMSGKLYTLMGMRKRIKELQDADIMGNDQTEIAKAVLADMQKDGEIRFEAGHLWQWNGAWWNKMDDAVVLKRISEDYGKLPAARKANDHGGIMKLIRTHAAKTLKELAVNGLNFANGFLTIDLELKPHNADYGATYMLPFRYLPDAWDRCPLWTTFLYDIWGTDDDYTQKVNALQEAMAVTMFGLGSRYQRVICLLGASRTGKSRILNLMEKLMPPGTRSAINPADWKDKFLPAELFGKLLNVAGELSGSDRIKGSKFKEIVTGEMIAAQKKNQDPFEFRPTCTHWFSSNHPPAVDDGDTGFSRRWLFLLFNHRIPEDKVIEDFEDVLLDHEREEIASWAVRGIIRMMDNARRGYTIPDSHRTQERELNRKINTVFHFLEACPRIVVGQARHEELSLPMKETPQINLFSEYQSFLISGAVARPVTLTKFTELMQFMQQDFGFKQKSKLSVRNNPETVYEYVTIAGKKAA